MLTWPTVPLATMLDLAMRWAEQTPTPGSPTDNGDVLVPDEQLQEGKVGTGSTVVNADVSPLDLLAPDSEMRRQGKGYLGWCPFHGDRAPNEHGRPGTPSFYATKDFRYGWRWRCLSTNCEQHPSPMRHSFRLLQGLRSTNVKGAIHATQRWPEPDERDRGEK